MLRYLTAGESHGPCLTMIIDGVPAGFAITIDKINHDLWRRQQGYGRGGRMLIEKDEAQVRSGIRWGETIGAPVALGIENRDWKNWTKKMSALPEDRDDKIAVTKPRPGHADLNGALKYDRRDVRDILERASARETVARTAVGSFAKQLLGPFGIRVMGYIRCIGNVAANLQDLTFDEIYARSEESAVRSADRAAEEKMIALIEECKKEGNTLGGIFEVVVLGLPPGLGSHTQWDRKLDGRLAQALMSIHAVKAVAVGEGFSAGQVSGAGFHDEILYDDAHGLHRPSNRAGGLEGGVTNGEELRAQAVVKPIPTLLIPLRSVDLKTKEPQAASVERSDTCVVPAAGVVGEAMVAFVLADALLEKLGGDSLAEFLDHLESTRARHRVMLTKRAPDGQ